MNTGRCSGRFATAPVLRDIWKAQTLYLTLMRNEYSGKGAATPSIDHTLAVEFTASSKTLHHHAEVRTPRIGGGGRI